MNDHEIKLLWEDEDFAALYKPQGLDVSRGRKGAPCVLDYMTTPGQTQWNGILHRLDNPVSGLLLWAKTPRALKSGGDLFRQRRIHKTYWAICESLLDPPQGRLTHHLIHVQKGNKSYIRKGPKTGGKKAILDYTLLKSGDRYHLYEIQLQTGRTHQIRAQMSAAGSPVKGDLKYGAKRSNPEGGIHLHSRSLEFTQPFTREKIRITADPPTSDRLWKELTAGLE